MKYTNLLAAAISLCACAPQTEFRPADTMPIDYPKSETVDQVDVHHNVPVADPYRWLEDDVRENPRVAEWVAAQNALTRTYLDAIAERGPIEARLRALWNFERYGIPTRKGGRYFYTYNSGLENQDRIYALDRLDGEPRLVLDPNAWSEDGTVALAGFSIDPTGRYAAYLVQDGGSDWRIGHVLDLDTLAPLDDTLRWLKFTAPSWRGDGSGFYYSRYPEPAEGAAFQSLNANHAVYFHRVGTAQADDVLVHTDPEHPDWGYGAQVSDDGAHLVITTWIGTDDRNQIVHLDLTDPAARPQVLIAGFDHAYDFIGNDGTVLFFKTTRDAPRGRIVAVDLADPDPARWREVVAPHRDVIEWASMVGGRIFVQYLSDAKSRVAVFEPSGVHVRAVPLPGIGSAGGFYGRVEDTETFFSYSSFDAPPSVYRYDVASGETTLFRRAEVDFDADRFTVTQLFYTSQDGTRVPMFVTHAKGIALDGTHPTLLTGYGGFNISMTPSFAVTFAAWLEMGGIVALPNLRGGGEYGEAWHKAGTRLQKQNVFDDFIAAAEHLIGQGYTRPDRLAIQGGSNGGLLVGAALNQRPDLFGAAIASVGVMDMLRFHLFTAGRFWTDDYGSAEDPDEFRALYAYSPYHNVDPRRRYPPVLVTTADTDDRVVPGHSFKYAARLQAAQAGKDVPVLIRIETRAGHGLGTPTDKVIEDYADRYAFLRKSLGLDGNQG